MSKKSAAKETLPIVPVVPVLMDAAGFIDTVWDLLPSIIAAKDVSSRNAATQEGEGEVVEGEGAGEASKESSPTNAEPSELPAGETAVDSTKSTTDNVEEAVVIINDIATSEDVALLLQLVHRASKKNITEAESVAEVATYLKAPINQDSGITKTWAAEFVNTVALTKWLEIEGDVNALSAEARHDIWQEYIRCILSDDPKAPQLLPVAEVLTHKQASHIRTRIHSYIPLAVYPSHDPIFDQMWVKVSGGKITVNEEDFSHWFNWVYFAIFDNATERRANMAARTHYYEAIQATGGECGEEAFRNTAERLYKAYCQHMRQTDCVAFYMDLMYQSLQIAKTAGESAEDAVEKDRDDNNAQFFVTARPKSTFGQGTLECPVKFHLVDDLDIQNGEQAVFSAPTKNRILVVGLPGIGKSTFGRKLAQTLGAVHIDVMELALKAIRDPKSPFYKELKGAVAAGAFPNKLQWQLVKNCIEDPATKHRGYVLSDAPNCLMHNQVALLTGFFEFLAPMVDPPQVVVEITCPPEAYKKWSKRALTAQQAAISGEHQLRADEAAAAEALITAAAEKVEKTRLREQRALRREQIASGEIEATPEDEAAAEEPEEEEAEEEEDEPLVDEDGNPLDEAQIAALQAEKANQVIQRRLEADLYEQYIAAHTLDPELLAFNPTENDTVQQFMGVAEPNDCTLQIPCYDATMDQVKYVTEKLKLVQRTIPTLPDVAADELEGVDPSTPEGEAAMVDINQRTLEGNTTLSLSSWKRFCPVTYLKDDVLFEGSWLFSCVYRNKYYCFASQCKRELFMACPHTYLLHRVKSYTPAAIFTETLSTLADAGVDLEALKYSLGSQLGLTALSLGDFAIDWQQHADEVARRAGIQTDRTKKDMETTKLREERKRKLREAEAKKKKLAEKGKKKKKVEEAMEEEAAPDADAADRENAEAAAPTIEEQLTAELERQKILRQSILPLLVDCTHIRDGPFNQVFDQRVLPEMAVVLQYKVPKPEDEEEEEEAAEDDEEEALGEPELDDEGNEIPRPPPPPVDLDDPKQYSKYVRQTVAKMNLSAEEAAAYAESGEVPAAPTPPADGEEGEGAAAAIAAPLPPQNFQVKTVNLYGMSLEDMARTILHIIDPVAELALPPSDGEELDVDEPLENEDEENPVHPLLIPGRRAVHQYGRTSKFCPWTLKEQGTLLQGNANLWLTFEGHRYTFVTQAAMDAFQTNPMRYLPTVPASIPAPRVCILGVPSAGKRTLAASFSTTYGIPTFPYSNEAFHAIMDAGLAIEGATVEGVHIPCQSSSKPLQAAIAIRHELSVFAAQQIAQIELKELTTKQQEERDALRDEGEEVDELDDEEEAEIAKILEFEPEEEESKLEREGLAERRIAALLMRVEPFESKGYVLVDHPSNETEFNQLIEAGAIPEVVIRVKLSVELFIVRRVDAEAAKRDAEYQTAMREVTAKKADIMLKTRAQELLRWRRRNIGVDDEPLEELEDIPEDPEEIPLDQTKADLEANYDTFSSDVDAVAALYPEKSIPVLEINGDAGMETVVSSTFDLLAPNLSRRRSLLEAAQIVSFKEATSRLLTGSHVLSSFGFSDPVALLEMREGSPPKLSRCPPGQNIATEAALPEILPPEPKKKELKMVAKLDEDGEPIIDEEGNPVEEEIEVEPEEEEVEAPEEDEEVELEAEPDLSPEELEEMAAEHQAKMTKLQDAKALKAVMLRNRIYFFKNEASLLKFMQNPLKYWDQAPPLDPVDSTVIAVMQDQPDEATPAAGNTVALPRNLAHHLALNLKFQYVDLPKLVKWVLKRRSVLPHLYAQAKEYLFSNEPLPNDFIAGALGARLHSVDIKSSGAVVHNLPRNWKQFMSLTSNSILFNRVYVVDDYLEEDVRVLPMIDGVARVVAKVTAPDTTECLMECFNQAITNVERRQTLSLRRKFGFPARIDGASVPEAQIEGSLSVFQWYCPYMWSHEHQLVDIRDERTHVAEYCGEVYCFSTAQSLADFMTNPERFSGEVSKLQELPTMLPSHIDASEIAKEQLEFCGCCPVTLYETRNHRGLKGITEPTAVLGSAVLTVEYDQKYYSLVDERAMTLFLRQPWVYTNGATLPLAHKLPFDNEKWKTLSAEHFITKALYEQVAGALLEVAQTRPKFPGLSIEDSARKFVALHLKAHNQNNTQHRKECYQQNFKSFEERATLYKTITTVAPEDNPAELVKFEHRCKVWDDVQDVPECYKTYAELK